MIVFGITLSTPDLYLLGIAGSLAVIVLGAIVYRTNAAIIKRREQRTELLNGLLAPFNDAIVNIEHAEHNYIMIMNALHERQRISISRAKAVACEKIKTKIERAWDNYESFYQVDGETRDIDQFISFSPDFEERQRDILRQHINAIIKVINDI